MVKAHTFHIPVMGLGFTVDTPLKVAQYGINSVIPIGDDILLEKLRKMYCNKFEIPYMEISDRAEDYRAKRITSYLNLINTLVKRKFEDFRSSATSESLDNYSPGSVDVNIMTKIDKDNYVKNEKLPIEYNDAHAALRGYAKSELRSSVIFSAGMNPRLYGYLEQFEDFYPTTEGTIKKKITLKVSDYRSAIIQGKYLAKKGLWVSEYRIESGLNCGGHAFATDGFLMGPILAEFRDKRHELIASTHELLVQALENKCRSIPKEVLTVKITAQGGVGTHAEHQFLLDEYKVDSVGWGTPFLLVPEATTVDVDTLEQLVEAKEDDLYLSDISPLNVPFNNLRGNSKDEEKALLIGKGRAGSSCPKKFLMLNTEFTERAICTASRQYQHLKIKQLKKEGLSDEEYKIQYDKVVEKSCICVGLGTSALLANNLDTKVEGKGVSICPGPNLAYFSSVMSLKEITDHIYGKANMIFRTDRPNMFIKELGMYLDYLKKKIDENRMVSSNKQEKYLQTFATNLKKGISYYYTLFANSKGKFDNPTASLFMDLDEGQKTLQLLSLSITRNA